MTHLKKLFETPMKAVISSVCAVGILAGVGTGTAYAASAIAENTSIGAENAQNFAFADAGVDPAEAEVIRTEFDFEQGQFVYEVEFTAGGTEYEYWIKSSDGTVVKKEVELVSLEAAGTTAEAAQITLDEAKAAALADAGLTADEVTFTQGKLDEENGVAVYDIEFRTATQEYEYEINAATGAVYSKSTEALTTAETASDATDSATETAGQLTLDEAKAVALADAGAAEADVTYTKAKLDTDDGVAVYDIEFYTSTKEYEYEINAATGAILDKSVEALAASADAAGSDSTAYIGVDKAKTIALSDAGVSASDATFTKAAQDKDDGVVVYDIEFYTSAKEYEYEINATTGAILDKDVETRKTSTGSTGSTGSTSNSGTTDSTGSSSSASYIGVDKAKTIALSDAGVSASDATFTKAAQDKDNGVVVYDIEFYTSAKEYEYEINATTGAILDKDVETRKTSTGSTGSTGGTSNSGTTGSTGSSSSASYIGVDKAKTIALSDAGVSASDATFTKAAQDKDDGVVVYDIEFYTSTKEYEYEINATTGAILDKDVETRKTSTGSTGSTSNSGTTDSTGSSSSASYIGVDKAKSIALSDAGVSASDATFTKAAQDKDDGVVVYDIEFYTSTKEYEYEINATTGAILDKDVETIKSNSSGSSSSSSSSSSTSYIGVDKAKSIAANHAGYSVSDVTFSKVKLDEEDGVAVYEIEFYKGNVEYEYEINATTGAILDYDSEVDD